MEKTLRLPAELGSLEPFRLFVLQCARDLAVHESRVPQIELVLEELLTNLVFHAYKEARGDVELACFPRGDAFCMRICDWSSPFNPLERPPPDLSAALEDRPIGGLGIHLVRKMADGLDYRRDNDQNIVEICFRRDTQQDDRDA